MFSRLWVRLPRFLDARSRDARERYESHSRSSALIRSALATFRAWRARVKSDQDRIVENVTRIRKVSATETAVRCRRTNRRIESLTD